MTTQHSYRFLVIFLFVTLMGCGSDPEAALGRDTDGDEESTGWGDVDLPPSGPGASSAGSHGGTGGASGGASDGAGDAGTTLGDGSSDGLGASESDSSDGGSTTGLEAPEPYADCYEGEQVGFPDCPDSCVQASDGLGSACAPDCGKGCPDGPGGVQTECLDADNASGVCVVPCSPGCPGGMQCMETDFVQDGTPMWLCMWE